MAAQNLDQTLGEVNGTMLVQSGGCLAHALLSVKLSRYGCRAQTTARYRHVGNRYPRQAGTR